MKPHQCGIGQKHQSIISTREGSISSARGERKPAALPDKAASSGVHLKRASSGLICRNQMVQRIQNIASNRSGVGIWSNEASGASAAEGG